MKESMMQRLLRESYEVDDITPDIKINPYTVNKFRNETLTVGKYRILIRAYAQYIKTLANDKNKKVLYTALQLIKNLDNSQDSELTLSQEERLIAYATIKVVMEMVRTIVKSELFSEKKDK